MIKEKRSPSGSGSESLSELKDLVLFNDDINTFDEVIEALVEVCRHELLQAEQCALIAHYKGKCSVRSGSFDELKPLHQAMSSRNLTVEIF